jgi:hypothetical protein
MLLFAVYDADMEIDKDGRRRELKQKFMLLNTDDC